MAMLVVVKHHSLEGAATMPSRPLVGPDFRSLEPEVVN